MAEILSVSRPKMIGNVSLMYAVPEEMNAPPGEPSNSKEAGPDKAIRLRLLRSDCSAVVVEVKQSPMRSASGEVIGTIGVFRVVEKDPEVTATNGIGLASVFASHLVYCSKVSPEN
jgi:hypothetical protein